MKRTWTGRLRNGGVLGRVGSSIRTGGTGEMVYTQMGTRRVCGARSEDSSAIAKEQKLWSRATKKYCLRPAVERDVGRRKQCRRFPPTRSKSYDARHWYKTVTMLLWLCPGSDGIRVRASVDGGGGRRMASHFGGGRTGVKWLDVA